MDRINSTNQIVEILRRQLHSTAKTGKKNTVASPSASSLLKSKASLEELEKTISRRITSIDKNNPDYEQHAVKLIVGTILTREFGEKIVNDPHFTEILDSVSENINHNEELKQKYTRFIAEVK